MNKTDAADIGPKIKSVTRDSSGKPEWVLCGDGAVILAVILAERFVESGAIKREQIKA